MWTLWLFARRSGTVSMVGTKGYHKEGQIAVTATVWSDQKEGLSRIYSDTAQFAQIYSVV
jgi:hypothetical protein